MLMLAKITAKKQAAFTANTELAPMKGSKNPPRAGPKIPEMLSCKPPRVAAEGSSEVETISGMIEVQAGDSNAKPAAIRNTATNTTWALRR